MKIPKLFFFTLAFSSSLDAETNALLRSGPMAQFGDTKIYTAEGIEISAGKFQESLFSESKRLSTAIQNATGAAIPAVAGDWQTTAEFEEWTDRLVVTQTTSFTLIDGERFHSEFFNGSAFTPYPGLEADPGTPPDILALATEYIDNNEHLGLYEDAKNAAEISPQALLDELANDVGPVTFVETIEFSRIVPLLEDPIAADGIMSVIIHSDPIAGADLGPGLSSTSRANFRNPALPQGLFTHPKKNLNTSATYTQEMLNGFTIGNTWSKSITYDRNWITFKTSAFATFGIGVRIPWEATVEVGPRRIDKSSPDKTAYDANLSIRTLNADEDFYRRVGLPTEHLFSGKETVLRAGAGITLYLKVLGKTLVNKGENNPLIGKTIDLGDDFDPPLGTTLNLASPELLYEDSGLAYQHWAFGIGGDFRANIGITGQNFELSVEPYKGWTKSTANKYSKADRSLQITAENSPKSLEFAIDDTSTSDGRTPDGTYYHFGAIYSDAQYHTSLDITPQARVRGTLKLSSIMSSLSDVQISSSWIDLFTASFDLPALGPHANTDDAIDAYTGNKRERAAYSGRGITREWEMEINTNKWTINLAGETAGIGEIVEFLPKNATVDPASITAGGIYNPSNHSITWNLVNLGEQPLIKYDLTTPTPETPIVVGSTRNLVDGSLTGIATFGTQDQNTALLTLQNAELSKRPTFAQLIDARPHSKILRSDETGKIELILQIQTTEDMKNWTDKGDPIVHELLLPATREFFRFGIE